MTVTAAHTQNHHDFQAHVRIRWSEMFGGWMMTCPRCIAFAVRSTWPEAIANANNHVLMHRKAVWIN